MENQNSNDNSTPSIVEFARKTSLNSALRFVDSYKESSDTRHQTHALVRSIVGVLCFWASPETGILGALIAFLLPQRTETIVKTADKTLNSFWFSLPNVSKLLLALVAVLSVLSMTHFVTIPILSRVFLTIGMVFSMKLGMTLYLSNWRKEIEQAKMSEIAKEGENKKDF